MNTASSPCPCGLGAAYSACCGRWHAGSLHLQAPDAQALMRSRYVAYVRHDAPYLLATWHASTRPAHLQFEAGQRWLGLDVKRHAVLDSEHATVAFVARCRSATGRAQRLQETSRFVREGGRWFYLDGEQA
jgi:SEC-C motif domain protein